MENTKDREGANHKWVTRERDKNGKWRYDYDKKKKEKDERLSKYGHEIIDGVGEIVSGCKDAFTKDRNVKAIKAEKKIMDSGRKFINELFRPIV